jgi:hypothetical protein
MIKYKYRTRRICHPIKEDNDENTNKKTINEYRTPSIRKTDLYLHRPIIVIKRLILFHYMLIFRDHLLKH